MNTAWENPIWHHVGLLGIVGFLTLVALVLIGRVWFASRDRRRSKIGLGLLGTIGGSRVAREALSESSKPSR